MDENKFTGEQIHYEKTRGRKTADENVCQNFAGRKSILLPPRVYFALPLLFNYSFAPWHFRIFHGVWAFSRLLQIAFSCKNLVIKALLVIFLP